jgi:hypothetical protein
MSGQKIPLQRSLPAFTRARILDEIAKRGYALPCHIVGITLPVFVTVAFDLADVSLPQVTIPVYGSQYQRQPYQIGDGGFTFPLAVDISAACGLGTGLPSINQLPANLSSLYWFPGGNKSFPAVDDPDKHVIYGPNGFELRDSANLVSIVGDINTGIAMSFGGCSVVMNATGITLSFGSSSIVINAAGINYDFGGNSTVMSDASGITIGYGGRSIQITTVGVTIDGIFFDTHTHADPQGGVVGPPE